MPPEHNQVQLEKAGARFSTVQCLSVGWRLFRQHHTDKSAWLWTNLCQMTVVSLACLQGSPQLLAAALGKPSAGTGREVSSRLPVSPCAGMGNSRADRKGIIALGDCNGWMGREGKCYFLNESPRVKASGLCTAAEAGTVTQWVIKEMPAPVWTHFLFWHSGRSLVSVTLCSSCLPHMLGKGCLSQKGRHFLTKWGSKAKPRGERFSHGVCFEISHLKCLYRSLPAQQTLPSQTFTQAQTHAQEAGGNERLYPCQL